MENKKYEDNYIKYIYKTTNLINGLIYIGQHSYYKDDKKKTYFGSGTLLNPRGA